MKEMERLGGRVKVIKEEWTSFDLEYHVELAKKILQEEPQADGIYAADILGTAFWKVLKEQGRRVPEDFEIISTDGVYENTNTVINLSAVIQPAEEIARQIARNILAQIEGKESGLPELVDVYLFGGDTTK